MFNALDRVNDLIWCFRSCENDAQRLRIFVLLLTLRLLSLNSVGLVLEGPAVFAAAGTSPIRRHEADD